MSRIGNDNPYGVSPCIDILQNSGFLAAFRLPLVSCQRDEARGRLGDDGGQVGVSYPSFWRTNSSARASTSSSDNEVESSMTASGAGTSGEFIRVRSR